MAKRKALVARGGGSMALSSVTPLQLYFGGWPDADFMIMLLTIWRQFTTAHSPQPQQIPSKILITTDWIIIIINKKTTAWFSLGWGYRTSNNWQQQVSLKKLGICKSPRLITCSARWSSKSSPREQHAGNAPQTEAFSFLPTASRISHRVYSWQWNFWLTDLSSLPQGPFSNTFCAQLRTFSLVLQRCEKSTYSSFWRLQSQVQWCFNLNFTYCT